MSQRSVQIEIEIPIFKLSNWHRNFQGTHSFSVFDKHGIGPLSKKYIHES